MKTSLIAVALAAATLAAPAAAQTRFEQDRWEAAQRRFEAERERYERERQRYDAAIRRERGYDWRRDRRYGDDEYYRGFEDDDFDPARDYRDAPGYPERRMDAEDAVYQGSDGRYYCRRGDGTLGLVVGGVGGALLGNIIDGGRNRTAGTLIGGTLGAIMGTAIGQNNVRCR
jgi:Glycine zipper 2TM domain